MSTDPNQSGRRSLLPMPLLILLAAYLCATLTHAWLLPTGQTGYQDAPDENAHVQYIRTLSAGHLPTFRDWQNDAKKQNYEWHQPPLIIFWRCRFIVWGIRLYGCCPSVAD